MSEPLNITLDKTERELRAAHARIAQLEALLKKALSQLDDALEAEHKAARRLRWAEVQDTEALAQSIDAERAAHLATRRALCELWKAGDELYNYDPEHNFRGEVEEFWTRAKDLSRTAHAAAREAVEKADKKEGQP